MTQRKLFQNSMFGTGRCCNRIHGHKWMHGMAWHGNGMALLYTANILASPDWHGPPGGQGITVSKDLLDTREQKSQLNRCFFLLF